MFSGLTNQVTSWIGQAKGEPQDEEVPAPPPGSEVTEHAEKPLSPQQQEAPQQPTELNDDGIPLEVAEDGDKKQSPTKAGGLFSGVKSSMTGWLGNASASIPSMPSMPAMPAMPAMSIPSIPGLRKANAGDGNEGGIANDGLSTSPDKIEQAASGGTEGERTHGDDDDRSRYISATEGADSGPGSPQPGTPTDEAGQMGNVTTKVTQSAKTFGSFLYSAVNKAGAKIKKTVEENHILGEFNKEQEAFAKNQVAKGEAVPPWVGHKNESQVKEEILTLSSDRRNFVRAPPVGVDFEFNYDSSYPIAVAIMAEDTALEKMRFDLVPKIITEENFWRNYFYRVSLICQAGDLGTLGEGSLMGQGSSEDAEVKNTNEMSKKQAITDNMDKDKLVTVSTKLNESEFVSETFQASQKDFDEVQEGLKKLGIDSLAKQATENDEQWEKDLEAELQDYEVVVDNADGKHDTNWENDVDELLGDDLK